MASRILREVIAFLISPIPATLLAALVSAASGYPDPIAGAVFVYLLLTVFGLIFGVPIRLGLHFRHTRSWVAFAGGGCAMVLTPVVPYMIWNAVTHVYPVWYAATSTAMFGVCGIVTGITYRAVSTSHKATKPSQ